MVRKECSRGLRKIRIFQQGMELADWKVPSWQPKKKTEAEGRQIFSGNDVYMHVKSLGAILFVCFFRCNYNTIYIYDIYVTQGI